MTLIFNQHLLLLLLDLQNPSFQDQIRRKKGAGEVKEIVTLDKGSGQVVALIQTGPPSGFVPTVSLNAHSFPHSLCLHLHYTGRVKGGGR